MHPSEWAIVGALSPWFAFGLGIALTIVAEVIAGLILLAIGRRLARRDEQRQSLERQADQESQRAEQHARVRLEARAAIRVSGEEIAKELEANAKISERARQNDVHVPAEAERLRISDWSDRRVDIAPLKDESPALWDELHEVYAEIERCKGRGDYPPPASQLRELAVRVREATND